MFTTSFGFSLPSLTILVDFAILHDIEQLVAKPYSYSWPSWRQVQQLDLFLTFNPYAYAVTLFSPLDSSQSHICILSFISNPSPPKQRCLWRFASASWGDLRRYYADFPGNGYCFRVRDPSLCTEHITEVIVSGMEAYFPQSFSWTKPSKLWFNTACSRVIYDREVAQKRYLSLPSPESHAL